MFNECICILDFFFWCRIFIKRKKKHNEKSQWSRISCLCFADALYLKFIMNNNNAFVRFGQGKVNKRVLFQIRQKDKSFFVNLHVRYGFESVNGDFQRLHHAFFLLLA